MGIYSVGIIYLKTAYVLGVRQQNVLLLKMR